MRSDVILALVISVAVIAGIVLALGWWSVRTCRTLWRHGTTEWGRLVYDFGVRGFGVIMAISFVAFGGYLGATYVALSADDSIRCAIAGVLLGASLGTPIALGMGYFWGVQMAWIYGLEPDADRPSAKRKRRP